MPHLSVFVHCPAVIEYCSLLITQGHSLPLKCGCSISTETDAKAVQLLKKILIAKYGP